MLHHETTSNELFDVLVRLMSMAELSDFRLVGGTALSLLRGHRESVGIDMFCDGPMEKFLSIIFWKCLSCNSHMWRKPELS